MENTNQFLHLSESEMLNIWKNLLGLEPHLCGCTIEREDGANVDERLITRMRQWYASLLLSAPENLLPVEDVKDELALMVADNGVVTAIVPPQCVRPTDGTYSLHSSALKTIPVWNATHLTGLPEIE